MADVEVQVALRQYECNVRKILIAHQHRMMVGNRQPCKIELHAEGNTRS